MSKDVFILHEWEKEKLDELVRITREENAIKRGLAKGIEQGIERQTIETAKEMLKENLDINLISKITKLSKEEIMNIKNSM